MAIDGQRDQNDSSKDISISGLSFPVEPGCQVILHIRSGCAPMSVLLQEY